jgi:hypothetical protein
MNMSDNAASPGFRMALGAILGVAGVSLVIVSFRHLLLVTNALQDQSMLGTLLGVCLVFFGVTILLPQEVSVRQRLFQALAVTSMALMFDWIAFVPGPREFHAGSSASHPGVVVNSTFGRVVFGAGAVLMDLFAFYMWQLSIRLLLTGSEVKQRAATGSKFE